MLFFSFVVGLGVVFIQPSAVLAQVCTAPNECQSGTCKTGFSPASGGCSAAGWVCCGLTAAAGPSTGYFNPLKFGSVEGVLTEVLNQLRNIIVILSIIFIIIGAVMYILSGGNEGRLTMAKGAITAALIGLAIGLAAPSFLKEIAELLGWTNVNNAQVTGAQSFTEIAGNVLNFLLAIIGILAIIMLVIGGFMYLTAAGDEGRAETGKKIITYATIAIAVALSALVLVVQVTKFFV